MAGVVNLLVLVSASLFSGADSVGSGLLLRIEGLDLVLLFGIPALSAGGAERSDLSFPSK